MDDLRDLADRELVRRYCATGGKGDDADAVLAEIERRGNHALATPRGNSLYLMTGGAMLLLIALAILL